MLATLAALAGAVLTVVVYAVAADRMDYATVQRRQLDLWVAVLGFGYLVTMLVGAAEVRRDLVPAPTSQPAVQTRPAVVVRRSVPDLGAAEGVAAAALTAPAPVLPEQAPAPTEAVAEAPAPVEGVYYARRARPTEAVAASPRELATATARATAQPPLASWQGVITPVLQVLPIDTPTQASAPIIVTVAPTAEPRRPTPEPTAAPTLEPPAPPPLPTAACGDPRDISVQLVVLDSYVDRRGDSVGVAYRAEVRNSSPFPVTLADVLAVVESRSVSERFGHESLADVTLEAGILHRLDGRVELSRSPSPFDVTEMCVSFVPETCGRSVPYRVVKHCLTTRGF